MATAKDVIAEARTWIDTPFLHQGRIKGRGADCVGLIIGVAHALNLTQWDYVTYNRQPLPGKMKGLLDEQMEKVDPKEMRPGDILYLAFTQPQHLALLTFDNTIIHINERIAPRKRGELMGRCVEHILNDTWRHRIVGVYRYRGLNSG